MRGIKWGVQQEAAVLLLENGFKPADVSRCFKLPLSTITTWNKKVRKQRREQLIQPVITKPSVDRRKEIIKNIAEFINDAEAKIMTTVGNFLKPTITDNQWMSLTKTIETELKNIAVTAVEKG
ncbi:MAG: hypothetical protein KBT03_03215 [Bacteroidales bacterium]|nr:hypothetical protein [Candidatus Scybalousia scybalohippi]